MMKLTRANSRTNSSIRETSVIKNFCPNSYGSVLLSMGNTKVICAASVDTTVPEHAKLANTGWLTAEYTMLPYSTNKRTKREFNKRDGRSVEIQRLIGRSLRAGIDLSKFQGFSMFIDCDVVQADGGTRTASITGGYIAMKLAVERMLAEGLLPENPLIGNIAAISVGIVDGEILLDLDYSEDSIAEVDMNIVMNHKFELIEIQGTGEHAPFTIQKMNLMIETARKGIEELMLIQNC
ncbi:MAG TPA: ribonuclease PH [Spirochaetota bacterium]|nr:ribonuclease PH [Spirochaetota bacterium]HOK93146.1 ribonuclease PH [Spirochaetota bacterium]HON15891.1 ribonuclease PH [Spirochaetota bacterium]HOQ10882.1 ribonuclease PH [Spirochaetota bacterium]HOV08713.1 ribonuclease PH [Spirochaetota bacterium]